MIDKRLERFYEDACDILDCLNIEYGPVRDVTINKTAKTRWGQCCYLKIEKVFNISISSRLLQSDIDYTDTMDTMLHELLHCHKDRMCHTGEWKRCASLVNKYFGYNIKRTTSAAEKNIENERLKMAKYVVTCDYCGHVSSYLKQGRIVKVLLKRPKGACKCAVCGNDSFTVEVR